jgi:hypothetical protein
MALTENIVSYWKLDESSGNAADSVGSNTGTNTNVTYTSGKINNGAVFNGITGFLSTSLAIPNQYTFSCWVKNNVTSGMILAKDEIGSRAFLLSMEASNKIKAWAWNASGTGYTLTSASGISTTDWVHVVVTWDTSNLRMYINGVEETPVAVTGNAANFATAFTFGKRLYSGSPTWYAGSLDELGVWSRALSSDEVKYLYNFGNGIQYPFTSGFLAFFI